MDIHYVDSLRALLDDRGRVAEMRQALLEGDVLTVRRCVSQDKIDRWIRYLSGIGRHSLPNYTAIEEGAPNFHRINNSDPRAYVKGCFHQFVFYPWNQDLLQIFQQVRDVYLLKNLLSDIRADKYLSPVPEDGCIARLAFQFYPSGRGYLNRHKDPVDYHQLCVPTLTMSKKGRDYKTGGLYVEDDAGDVINVDDHTQPGDVLFFNASQVHGIEPIDPEADIDWTDFKGRWMLLLAINRLANNTSVADAQELEPRR
jgi:hypothetical protein